MVVMGDLNAGPDSAPLKLLKQHLSNSREFAGWITGPEGTWNGFDPSVVSDVVLDYILVRGMNVHSNSHYLQMTSEGRHLSDHLAVGASLEFQ